MQAVIDTGFLTVPLEFGIAHEGGSRATLADGSEMTFDVYDVAVLWDGQPRYVLADAANTTPLVGVRLLYSHNLNIDVEDGGSVVIQARE